MTKHDSPPALVGDNTALQQDYILALPRAARRRRDRALSGVTMESIRRRMALLQPVNDIDRDAVRMAADVVEVFGTMEKILPVIETGMISTITSALPAAGALIAGKSPVPDGVACKAGCSMCCIFNKVIAVTVVEAEAVWLSMQASTAEPHPHPKACPALSADGLCVAQERKPSICATYYSMSLPLCTDLMSALDGTSKVPDHPPAIGHSGGWVGAIAVTDVLRTLTGASHILLDLKPFLRAKLEGHDTTTAMRLAFLSHDTVPPVVLPLRVDTYARVGHAGRVVMQELDF